MAQVKFKRGNKQFIDNLPIVDGQLIYNTDAGNYYIDVRGKRISGKDYVTPEMFGAVGDGVTDDTEAIQKAINFGILDNKNALLTQKYSISKALVINGNCKIIGNNKDVSISSKNTDAFFVIQETGTEHDERSILIENLTLNAQEEARNNVKGIKVNASGIIYSVFKNITLNDGYSIIHLISTEANQSYAHNVDWGHLHCNGTTAVITQEIEGENPWVYSGIVYDCDYEKTHLGSSDYIYDLRGFHNTKFMDIIIEGEAVTHKKSAFLINDAITFDGLYFEIINGANFYDNYMVSEGPGPYKIVVDRVYGYLIKNSFLLKKGSEVYLSFRYPCLNIREILDYNSVGNLKVSGAVGGALFHDKAEECLLDPRINYVNEIWHDDVPINIASIPSTMSVDFSKFNEYQGTIHFSNVAGVNETGVIDDPMFGKCLSVTNREHNLICNQLIFNLEKLGFKPGDSFCVAITYKTLAKIPTKYNDVTRNHFSLAFNKTVEAEPNKFITILNSYKATDYPWHGIEFDARDKLDPEDSTYPKQTLIIADISFFKGNNFGVCKSSANIAN